MLQSKIQDAASRVAEKLGFLLVDTAIRGDNRKPVVQIFIDSIKGVTTDDCALMSSEVAAIIDTENIIDKAYRIEVSSPGVDRALKFLEQYHQHVNRKFEIEYAEGEEQFTIQGKLVSVEGDIITLMAGKEELKINYNNIKTAKVLISF